MTNNTGILLPEIQRIKNAYIHVPFCKSKCYYCDFNSYQDEEDYIDAYFDAMDREIQIVGSYYESHPESAPALLDSVYIGGGTPSYVSSRHIVKIMDTLRRTFGFSKDAEITIECNPGTVCLDKFNDYRGCGINRLSIGLQSASDNILKNIGRIHSLEDFEKCIEFADRSGFYNRNVDLMFGLPAQTMEDVHSSIKIVMKKKLTHVSFYSLILEEGTAFYNRYAGHPEMIPSEEMEREMYWTGVEEFQKHGFLHYEISNLAKTGFECRQNKACWETQEYLGFGAGAHSYQQSYRIENEKNIPSYIKKIFLAESYSNAPAGREFNLIGPQDRELEFMMLGFRLLRGIGETDFYKTFSRRMDEYMPRIQHLIGRNYLEFTNGRYRLTHTGIDFANQVFMEFV